jgi:hypothetical protein
MNRKILVLALASVTFASGAIAGEIYKYVDDQGNVQYGDRPTGASGEERMAVVYTGTSSSSLDSQAKRHESYMAEREERRSAQQEQAEADAQAALEREERAAKCQQNRSRLESYLQSNRMYRENAAGEREYLDEDQMLEARQKAEDLVKEYCS